MTWRVGNHQPRNIYLDDEFAAVCIGPDDIATDLALVICEALNRVQAEADRASKAQAPSRGKVNNMTNQDSQRRQQQEQERQEREQREQQEREQQQGQGQQPQQPNTGGQQ